MQCSSKKQCLVGCEGNPQHHQQSHAARVHTCVQQEVAALSAASSHYQAQLEGLQTILVTKVSQCSRLEKELRETSKQLRQVEAAAAADHAAMAQQLQQLSDGAAGLQEALAAGRQREQQLEAQLAATRAKVRAHLTVLMSLLVWRPWLACCVASWPPPAVKVTLPAVAAL